LAFSTLRLPSQPTPGKIVAKGPPLSDQPVSRPGRQTKPGTRSIRWFFGEAKRFHADRRRSLPIYLFNVTPWTAFSLRNCNLWCNPCNGWWVLMPADELLSDK